MGDLPQPVTTRQVLDHCELHRIRSQAYQERLFEIIRKLDAVFLNHIAERREANAKK